MNPSSPHKPDAARDYTDKDVRLKPVITFFAVTAALTAATFYGVRSFMTRMDHETTAADQAASPFAAERVLPATDLPRLQVNPLAELAAHRAYEAGLLQHYAWVDQAGGVVRVPVSRAMELLAERGLPARAPAAGAGN